MATSTIDAQPSRRRGVAPAIRKLKDKYPEMSNGAIARKVGCSTQNVSGVLNSYLAGSSIEDLQDFQSNKAEIYDALQHRMLGSITQESIAKAPLMAVVTSAAILQDKSQVLRGQATGINVVALLDVVKAIKASEQSQVLRSASAVTIQGE